jgi:hypothetical protein
MSQAEQAGPACTSVENLPEGADRQQGQRLLELLRAPHWRTQPGPWSEWSEAACVLAGVDPTLSFSPPQDGRPVRHWAFLPGGRSAALKPLPHEPFPDPELDDFQDFVSTLSVRTPKSIVQAAIDQGFRIAWLDIARAHPILAEFLPPGEQVGAAKTARRSQSQANRVRAINRHAANRAPLVAHVDAVLPGAFDNPEFKFASGKLNVACLIRFILSSYTRDSVDLKVLDERTIRSILEEKLKVPIK